MRKIEKILFITLTNIGDVVLTLPSFDYLKSRFKDAKFTVLSGPNASILFSHDPRVKENISYNKHSSFSEKLRLFNRLRRENFDVIIDLRDTAFRWFAAAQYKNPYIIKIPQRITHLRLKHLYKTLAAFKETDKILGIKIPARSIVLDEREDTVAKVLLKNNRLSLDADYIVVAPGARSTTKRWPRQGFIKVCHELVKHYCVVFLGDDSDSVITQDINKHLGQRCVDLAGQTSLLEAVAILKRAKLVICNDSSIMQFSSYLNVPVLAIFGPTDENKYGPASDVCAVVRKNKICTPCQGDDCNGEWDCMIDISPDRIVDTAVSLLHGKSPYRAPSFRRILLSRTDRLGDVLLSTPVIKNLRDHMPNAYIAVMVKESLSDLLSGNPYLDEVIGLDKRGKHKGWLGSLRFARELKKKNFDLVLVLHPTVRAHFVLFLAGIKQRIGYNKKWGFLNSRIIKHTKHLGEKHETEYALDFLKELGIPVPDKNLFMPVDKKSEERVVDLIKQYKFSGNKIVAVHRQASCPSKAWPKDYFQRLIDDIIKYYKANIIYVGENAEENIEESSGRINLTGKTDLAQLASVLKHSDLFISNDSGPVHMAVALGTPVISIFGRKQPGLGPKRWGPLGRNSVYLQKDVGCQVCLAHDCQKNFACLKSMEPKDVFVYVDKFLSK